MKITKKKVAKYALRAGTAIGALMLGIVPAYLLTPNRVNIIDLTSNSTSSDKSGSSHLNGLISRYTRMLDTGVEGLHGEFEDFTIDFNAGESENHIAIDGALDFTMRNLNDLDLNLMLNVAYNADENHPSRTVPITVGYVDGTAYLRLYDLGLKASQVDFDNFIETVTEFYGAADEETGHGLNLDLAQMEDDLNSMLKNMSLIDLLNKASESKENEENEEEVPSKNPNVGTAFGVLGEEVLDNDEGYVFKFSVTDTSEVDEQLVVHEGQIHIYSDIDYNIEKIDLCPTGYEGGVKFGNVTIKGALNTHIGAMQLYAPDDVNNPRYQENFTYVEVFNYYGWLKKIANFLSDDGKKMSFDFAASLSADHTEKDEETGDSVITGIDNIGRIQGSMSLDASRLIKLDQFKLGFDGDKDQYALQAGDLDTGNENINKVLNNVDFGLNVALYDADDELSANLDVKYADEAGYVTLNESEDDAGHKSAVIKAKVETETINWLIANAGRCVDEISADIADIAERFNAHVVHDDEADASGFLDFLMNSDVVTAVKAGNYAAILDVIKTFSNNVSEKKINIVLDLSGLGFGEDAELSIVLDSSEEESAKVITINATDVAISGVYMDFYLGNCEYVPVDVGDPDDYDSLSFLPTVMDQVTGILNDKQVAFNVEASVKDADNTGVDLTGFAQFDYDQLNKGFGQLNITEYKNKDNPNEVWFSHDLAIDVDNYSNDASFNNVKVIYGSESSNSVIKGKFTMQTFYDLYNSIKTLLDGDNPRYTKFTDALAGGFATGGIADLINNHNYFRIAKSDFIKEIRTYGDDELKITIGKDMFGLNSDLKVVIKFTDDQKIESLELIDFVLGENESVNNINAKITLVDYDPNVTSPVPVSNEGFYDLSSISTLVKYGINSTELGYYHITGNATLTASVFKAIDLDIDVKIAVDGTKVKLYGTVEIPAGFITNMVGALSGDSVFHTISLTTTSMKSEFTFQTYEANDPNRTNDIGGYFDIKKTVKFWFSTKVFHYRTTSTNFMDNLTYYVMDDLLDINSNLIGNLTSGDEGSLPGKYTEIFDPINNKDGTVYGYQYDAVNDSWQIGLNLANLLRSDTLQNVTVNLTTQTVNNVKYFNQAVINLNMHALVDLSVSATLSLRDINSSWSNATESAFNALRSVSNASFGSKLNAKDKYLTY